MRAARSSPRCSTGRPGQPLAYALFAHCFTCGKDNLAAKRIAEGLTGARHRGAALRLHRARRERGRVRQHDVLLERRGSGRRREPPARDVPGARDPDRPQSRRRGRARRPRSIARRCARSRRSRAPADPAHVTGLFKEHVPAIEEKGEVEVALAGRPFRIRKEFLDDIADAEAATIASRNLRKALLVLHSPTDDLVGIDNASAIFSAAKHPKSFVSLSRRGPSAQQARRCGLRRRGDRRLVGALSRHGAGAGRDAARRRAGRRDRATASSSSRSSPARIAISPTSRCRSAATAAGRAPTNICSRGLAPARR